MRFANLLIIGCLCLHITVALAQNSVFNQSISGSYNNTPVSFVLKDIQKKYSVNFSYANNLPSLNKKINLTFENLSLEEVLKKIFEKTEVNYVLVGNQIVLRKKPSTVTKIKSASHIPAPRAAGLSYQEKQPDSMALISVTGDSLPKKYHAPIIDSVLQPSSFTYLKIAGNTKEELDREYIKAQGKLKQEYKILSDSLNASPEPADNKFKSALLNAIATIETEIRRISDSIAVKPFLKTLDGKRDTTKSNTGLIYRPIQLGIVPLMNSNGLESENTVNNFSMNLIGGYAAGLEGVEVSSVFNIEKEYVHGTQYAGVFNIVKKDVTGAQFAGVFNTSGGPSRGGQVAGLFNVVADSMTGFQGAGFCNIVKGNYTGVQTAGFMNVVNGTLKGPQIAGFMNYVKDSAATAQLAGFININRKKTVGFQGAGFANIAKSDVKGTQVAGFLNTAKKLQGSQIGIINFADSVSGAQIGLLSFARKGYKKLDVYTSELTNINLTFKLGSKRFYNLFSLSADPFRKNNFYWMLGYGIGSELNLSPNNTLNLELLCNQVNQKSIWTHEYLNLLNQFKVTSSFKLSPAISAFVGPTFNVMVSQQKGTEGQVLESEIPKYDVFSTIEKNTQVVLWPGINLGIRF